MTNDMNRRIREMAGRAPDPIVESDRRISDLERQIAEAKVAQEVADGATEGLARQRHGLDAIPDYGGGFRGPTPSPISPDRLMGRHIREIAARQRGQK